MSRLFGHDQNINRGEEIMVVPPDGDTPHGPYRVYSSILTTVGREYTVTDTDQVKKVYDIEVMRMGEWLDYRRRTAN